MQGQEGKHKYPAIVGEQIDKILLKYSPMVYHYFLRMGLGVPCTEELTQETFRRVWRGLKGFRGNSSLKTWILTIARHVSYHHFKKERKQPELLYNLAEKEQDLELYNPRQLDPEQSLLLAERRYSIEQLLETLPPFEREVMILHGLEELSQREVAGIMRRSLGWVNKKWHDACGRLKRKILRLYREDSHEDFFNQEFRTWQPQTTLIMAEA